MASVTIYIHLPQEPVDVWAPVSAEHVRDDIYRIVDCRGEDEGVEFGNGSLERCRWQDDAEGRIQVAYEAVA
jgi:hypothetical protein